LAEVALVRRDRAAAREHAERAVATLEATKASPDRTRRISPRSTRGSPNTLLPDEHTINAPCRLCYRTISVSDPVPVPRFDPGARAPGLSFERRGRLLVLAAGAMVLAVVASSVANAGRASLRCVDGQLVAHRGALMPAGEEPLDDPSLPPLSVPPGTCEDEELTGLSELRDRYREIARTRMDEAMRSEDRRAIESTMDALDAMVEPSPGGDEDVLEQRRDLLESIVDAKVEEALARQQDALRWIERARNAGVEPARLRAAERALGLPTAELEAPEPEHEPEPEPAAPSPTAAPHEPATPRSL
jgi:hypothetical protein